jgi:hypothetical protein
VHGEFGSASGWAEHGAAVTAWLRGHRGEIQSIATALTAGTSLQLSGLDPYGWVVDTLVPRIAEIATESQGSDDLSERLAERGVLPMFGFPTRVRYLYTRRPAKSWPWPPSGVIDRDLALAASVFAPGSEVVKDGAIHTAIGIAGFRPGAFKPTVEPEPLGDQRAVAVCRACSFVTDEPIDSTACPACGAGTPDFAIIELAQPLGFRATRGEDFDGTFSWSARAMAARAHADFAQLARTTGCGPTVHAGPGEQFTINDNRGRLFTLLPAAEDWGGWVTDTAVDADQAKARPGGEARHVALGAIQETDLFFLSPSCQAEGLALTLEPTIGLAGETESLQGRRAAWYSLAFGLRRAAAPFLDVSPQEFSAGIFTGSGGKTAAFLADALENGAGYSTHLARRDVLPKFFEAVRNRHVRWEHESHASSCSASCYACLRDYGNMAYHALLDWRLARDLFIVLTGGSLDISNQLSREKTILQQFCYGFHGKVVELAAPVAAADLEDGRILILRHPLETTGGSTEAGRHAAAIREVDGSATTLIIADSFLVDRDPGAVNAMGNDGWSSLL